MPSTSGPLSVALRRAFIVSSAICTIACGSGESGNTPREKDPEAAAQPMSKSQQLAHEAARRLRKNAAEVHSPADGQGRVWLEPDPSDPDPLRVGSSHRFRFAYEAGPLGIAEGGALYFQAPPSFGWSRIQPTMSDLAGYTTFSTTADGVKLEAGKMENPYLLPIVVRGRALRAGERIEVVYGAGERLAQVDRFAEKGERFWFYVDGDGDKTREAIWDSPSVDILPGPAAQLELFLPATARPGDTVPISAALLDAAGNRTDGEAARLVFVDPPSSLELPAEMHFDPTQRGVARVTVPVVGEGVVRLRARVERDHDLPPLEGESNPMLVQADAPRILWADLHGHTNWSDGTGVPEDYLLYARDVAALDVAALTDHDHWGTPWFDKSPERWQATRDLVAKYYDPGRFVTVLGFEWTSWDYGHRHVLYFDQSGDVLSSIDAKTETPTELWQALRGRNAMTIAHHSAGGPVPIDWSFAPDPELEPVTEVASVHGSSEAEDTPLPIYDVVPGHWIRDQLTRGYRLGFIGSGDSHDGHPGLPQLAAPSGGLAGVIADDRTRESVATALRARRTFATNGPRMLLRVSLGGRRMGELVSLVDLAKAASANEEVELVAQVIAPKPLARIDVIHNRQVVESLDAEGRREVLARWSVPPLDTGDFVYVRAVQQDGGAAWSSPWFIE
jgi:hypothetical protein